MIAFIHDDRLTLVDLESKNKYWNEEYFFHDVWQIEFESETNEIVVFLEDGSSPRFRIAGGSLVLSPAHDTREIPVQIERARVVKEPYSRRFPVEFEIEGASCCLLERYDSVFLSPEGRLVAAFRQAQAPHFYRLSSRSPVP